GINFLDNCWDYNAGASEIRMGKALRDGYRDKAFLMTKIDGRNKETAARQIDESLRRLQTDRIDLMQFHEVIRMTDPERVFARDGALEAVAAAHRDGRRMPPLCHELADERRDYRLRLTAGARTGTARSTQLSPAERGGRGSAARPDGGRRARREVRAVQNDPSFRWDIPESTMAG